MINRCAVVCAPLCWLAFVSLECQIGLQWPCCSKDVCLRGTSVGSSRLLCSRLVRDTLRSDAPPARDGNNESSSGICLPRNSGIQPEKVRKSRVQKGDDILYSDRLKGDSWHPGPEASRCVQLLPGQKGERLGQQIGSQKCYHHSEWVGSEGINYAGSGYFTA